MTMAMTCFRDVTFFLPPDLRVPCLYYLITLAILFFFPCSVVGFSM